VNDSNQADDHAIGDEGALRQRYRAPSQPVLDKARPVVDPVAARFIASCPLVVLATTSSTGADASPRGGPPGFVKVLDEGHVAFADLAGNNRLDSYANIVEHPEIGMLFLVPGIDETLRINGRAHVTTAPEVLERAAIDAVKPKVAIVVAVQECYIHCAKALRRSGVWQPSTWAEPDSRPTAAEVIVDQFSLDIDASLIEEGLEADYKATLWNEGGH
jgi:PPOX class probable FMN-dependent enzyme